jgi:ABC-type transport system substrate-binding protein
MLKVLTDTQKQVILGTLLGYGFICDGENYPYLCIQHKVAEEHYLYSKIMELNNFSRKKAIYRKQTGVVGWRSKPNEAWKELYHLTYKDKKKHANDEWLNLLKDTGITVWFCDSGEIIDGKMKLNTQTFQYEGNEVIQQYFKNLGINCEIVRYRRTYFLMFDEAGTQTIKKIIYPIVPECILSKFFNQQD